RSRWTACRWRGTTWPACAGAPGPSSRTSPTSPSPPSTTSASVTSPTPPTKAFVGGVDLSGGEWQRIATARAAMRDAALVILDEPTAALDAQAEHDLFQRFRELAAGRTVLLISHRFSTVRMADRILVLEDGAIIEDGSHEALLALGGRYSTLYEM